MKILVDFHHSSLLRSLVMLFQDRLSFEVFRPIGTEWFFDGYWGINDQLDTAEQFLGMSNLHRPKDGTPKLNGWKYGRQEGIFEVSDPGELSFHEACSLDFFKDNDFDFVICSIPQHIEPFKRLIAQYQPKAKLIVQIGNNWPGVDLSGMNVLASVAPQMISPGANVIFYHQEFDTKIFSPSIAKPTKFISSYINILQNTGIGWRDFIELEKLLTAHGFDFKSYGGQCRDGNMNGPLELANSMRESQFVFHVKPGGDGFGHIIHNAFAMGRPVITRPSHYEGQLAAQLLKPGLFIDLDRVGRIGAANTIMQLTDDEDALFKMGRDASERFKEVVNYEREAKEISGWMTSLL